MTTYGASRRGRRVALTVPRYARAGPGVTSGARSARWPPGPCPFDPRGSREGRGPGQGQGVAQVAGEAGQQRPDALGAAAGEGPQDRRAAAQLLNCI